MSEAPYRNQSERSVATRDSESHPDRDLLPALALFWLASVARVAVGVVGGETLGAEATAALVTVVMLPVLVCSSIRARLS